MTIDWYHFVSVQPYCWLIPFWFHPTWPLSYTILGQSTPPFGSDLHGHCLISFWFYPTWPLSHTILGQSAPPLSHTTLFQTNLTIFSYHLGQSTWPLSHTILGQTNWPLSHTILIPSNLTHTIADQSKLTIVSYHFGSVHPNTVSYHSGVCPPDQCVIPFWSHLIWSLSHTILEHSKWYIYHFGQWLQTPFNLIPFWKSQAWLDLIPFWSIQNGIYTTLTSNTL